MKSSSAGAGVFAACLLLTGCQTIPDAEVLEKNPWDGTRFKLGPVPVPSLAARVASAPGASLDAIPARVDFAPKPDSWTYEFAGKLLDLASATRSHDKHLSITDPVTLASYYLIIGRPDRLAQVEASLSQRIIDKPGDLDAECKEKDYPEDDCTSEAKKHLVAASIAWLRGDATGATRRFEATEKYANRIRATLRTGKSAEFPNLHLSSWYDARTTFLVLSGRLPEAVTFYKQWRKYEEEAQDIPETAPHVFRSRLELFRLSGRARDIVALARMIGADPDLAHLGVLDLILDNLDFALAQGGDTRAAKAYLKVAMEFPGYYPKASMVWRNVRSFDFECHAARIAAADGDKKRAAEVLDALLPLYHEMPEDGGYELGYCLYKLTEALGNTAPRPALIETMRIKRSHSLERLNAINAATIYGFHSNGRSRLSEGLERRSRAMHKISVVTAPAPKAYVFLQPKVFEDSLIAALEATKDPQIEGSRGHHLGELFTFALKRYHLVGEG